MLTPESTPAHWQPYARVDFNPLPVSTLFPSQGLSIFGLCIYPPAQFNRKCSVELFGRNFGRSIHLEISTLPRRAHSPTPPPPHHTHMHKPHSVLTGLSPSLPPPLHTSQKWNLFESDCGMVVLLVMCRNGQRSHDYRVQTLDCHWPGKKCRGNVTTGKSEPLLTISFCNFVGTSTVTVCLTQSS
jgi:hypothetical protein